MRVLHVIAGVDPRYGGPIAALGGLAGAQVEVGLDVRVVATFGRGQDTSVAHSLTARGVRVELIGPTLGPLSWHRKIRPMLRRMIADVDVVHVHGIYEEVVHRACRVAHALRKPCLVRACGMLDPWSLAQKRLKKRLYMVWRLRRDLDSATAIHATTGMERAMISRLALRPPIIVEPNGVSLAEYEALPKKGSFRRHHPELGDSPFIAFLGRIHPQKGLELLVPALAKLRDRRVRLVVIGPDSRGFKATVERMIAEHGVGERVLFVGALAGEDKVAALADAELLALPSFHENFGIVVVEALAAGTPVVVSDHVYVHEEISAGKVGGVCPLDASLLARELDRWLGDGAMRRDAAERAPSFVRERYDWRKIAARWASHYAKLAR